MFEFHHFPALNLLFRMLVGPNCLREVRHKPFQKHRHNNYPLQEVDNSILSKERKFSRKYLKPLLYIATCMGLYTQAGIISTIYATVSSLLKKKLVDYNVPIDDNMQFHLSIYNLHRLHFTSVSRYLNLFCLNKQQIKCICFSFLYYLSRKV